jgi:Tol biopolymer transport system component
MRRKAAVAALASIVSAIAAAPASATWPGEPGLIAYSDGSIQTSGLDGSPARAIADGGTLGLSWSRDGERIVFSSLSGGLATVAADGSDPQTVISGDRAYAIGGSQYTYHPSWSPDGSRIVFMLPKDRPVPDYDHYGTIHTVRPDGSGLRQIARGEDAAWSPDGKLIAFAEEDGDLAAVRPNGKRYRVLARHRGGCGSLDFAPHGRRLAYTANGSLRTLDLRTGRRTRIPSEYAGEVNAIDVAWAPDGRRIAYVHWSPTPYDELRTVTPHGRRVKTLLRLPPEKVTWSFSWQTR